MDLSGGRTKKKESLFTRGYGFLDYYYGILCIGFDIKMS
jgi:hypothetical protein